MGPGGLDPVDVYEELPKVSHVLWFWDKSQHLSSYDVTRAAIITTANTLLYFPQRAQNIYIISIDHEI